MSHPSPPPSRFSQIKTETGIATDPQKILDRYSRAIPSYIERSLAREGIHDDAETVADCSNDFALKLWAKDGFKTWTRAKGGFRFYLKTVVHHHVIDYLKKNRRDRILTVEMTQEPEDSGDEHLDQPLGKEVYRHAMKALRQSELQRKTVHAILLDLRGKYPEATSKELGRYLHQQTGKQLTVANIDKQLSRARKRLAILIVQEVKRYHSPTTHEELYDELCAMGLWTYVKEYI